MIKQIQTIAEQEQYLTKIVANNIVKINFETPETYKIWSENSKIKIFITTHTN
jgi:hypothetical protein